jgi:hypothetical protein
MLNHTIIILYNVVQVNTEKLYEINDLEKIAVLGAGGKKQTAPWNTQFHLKKMRASRSTQEFVITLYSTIDQKSTFAQHFYCDKDHPAYNRRSNPTQNCSSLHECNVDVQCKDYKINQQIYIHAYSVTLSSRFIGNAQRPCLRIRD